VTRLLVSCRFAPFGETPALAARHGQTVVERDGVWHESFASHCWRGGGRGAPVSTGHGRGHTAIGEVVVCVARDGWWMMDAVVESDDAKILERIRVGQPVSVGFDDLDTDDDYRTHVRRHLRADLKHIAVLARGQVPGYRGAAITSVVEAKLATANPRPSASPTSPSTRSGGVDWRSQLPADWREFCLDSDAPPLELIKGRTIEWRWTGSAYVRPAARLAA
jgi:hypothetical protein